VSIREEICITCCCGHVDPIEAFETAPNTYRCPACGYAWRVEILRETADRLPSGYIRPAKLRIIETEASA
jgi:hypothetical protein